MAWNATERQRFDLRSIGSGDQTVYHLGRTYCPGAGWLVAWSLDTADQTELTAVAYVAGAGSLSSTFIESADMSRHGLIALPWPVIDLTVKADSSTVKITLHAYAIETGGDLAGWPYKLYSTNLQNLTTTDSATVTIPKGCTAYSVNGKDAHTVELLDVNGNTFDKYTTSLGNVTIGQVAQQPARYTVDGGSVKITNDGGGTEDLVLRWSYDLRIGSSVG